MLHKYEKIIFYLSGVFSNLVIITILKIINDQFLKNVTIDMLNMVIINFIIFNLLPLINTDGYKIILTLLNINEYEHSKHNHWIVKILIISSYCLALFCIWNIISIFI